MEFAPEISHFTLVEGVATYEVLACNLTFEMKIFRMWFYRKYSDMMNRDKMPPEYRNALASVRTPPDDMSFYLEALRRRPAQQDLPER